MWREKNIYFTEHDIYFTKLMFILKNINLELKSALRTKYIFYRILLYSLYCKAQSPRNLGTPHLQGDISAQIDLTVLIS